MRVRRRVADREPDDGQGAEDHRKHRHEAGEGKRQGVVAGLTLAVRGEDSRRERALGAHDQLLDSRAYAGDDQSACGATLFLPSSGARVTRIGPYVCIGSRSCKN